MTVDELMCKIECGDLLARLCTALDQGDADGAADLFTDDGAVAHPAGGQAVGPDVRKMFHARSKDIVTRHIMTNVLVTPMGQDAASGRAYILVYRVPRTDTTPRPLPSTPQGAGDWVIEFRKTGQGWRISRYAAQAVLEPNS